MHRAMSHRWHSSVTFVLVLLTALIHLSMQQPPSLTTTSVYPFAPFFVLQPYNTSATTGIQLTPYGAYAFAYPQNSQSQVNYMTLPCLAQANPTPTYQWKINGTIMQSSSQFSYLQNGLGDLTISPLSPGTYQCVVTSGSAVALSDVVNLTAAFMRIITPAASNTFTVSQGSYYLMPQNAIQYNSFPPPIITWQRDNNNLNTNSYSFQSVTFDNRVILDELGRIHITYVLPSDGCSSASSCLNSYRLRYQLAQTNLQQTPALTTLNVQSASPAFQSIQFQYSTPSPVTVLAGTSVRIVCIYSGTPPIVVSYTKITNTSTTTMDTSNNVLVIPNAQLSDSGTYQCQATQTSQNNVMQPLSIVLNVLSPPEWITKPVDVFVPAGGQITIPCIALGNPTVSTQWYVNSMVVPTGDPNQLVTGYNYTLINAQKPKDNRAVQCMVQNSFATYVANAAITVINPTQIVTAPSNQLQISPNSVVSFVCEALGDPLLNVNINWWWTDINGNLHLVVSSPGTLIVTNKNGSNCQQTLTIDTSQFSDKNLVRGSYMCLASNGWSAANATGRLSFYGDADGLVAAASFDWWIIGLVLGLLLLILLIVLIIICCRRNRGATYGVDEKERAQGNDPTADLKRMHGFTEYVRPDSQPADGSRSAPADAHAPPPVYPNDAASRPESEIGEDGSFRGAYAAGVTSPTYPAPSHYAATNAAFQPPAGDRSAPPIAPSRNKPLPAQPTYYSPPQQAYDNNVAVSDSIV